MDARTGAERHARAGEYSDVIIGTVEDSALTVGVKPDDVDIELGRQTDAQYLETARMLAKRFGAGKVAMMERESISSNDCNWFMKLYDAASDTMAHSREYAVRIIDNVGCGDAFGGGLIYALRAGMSDQEAVEFGTAAGALKHTINGDYNLITREKFRRSWMAARLDAYSVDDSERHGYMEARRRCAAAPLSA